MSIFTGHDFPYTDFHELNLDWVIKEITKLHKDYDEFKVLNTITFGGSWDINTAYAQWCIVSSGNMGYISIKPVPSGVLLTNEDYWRLVADYGSILAGLQARVIALENHNTNVTDPAISTLTTRVNNVGAMANRLDYQLNGDIILIGDSYALNSSAGGNSWANQIKSAYGDKCHVIALGGTGFGSDVYMSDNFLTMLQSSQVAYDTVSQIIVVGGANDGNLVADGRLSTTVLGQRITSFIDYVATHYGYAKVKIAFVGWYIPTANYQTYINAFNNAKTTYRDYASRHKISEYFCSGEVILHDTNLINPNDRIHPTQTGSNELAKFVFTMVNGGNYLFDKTEGVTCTPVSGVSFSSYSATCRYSGNSANFTIIGGAYNGGYMSIDFGEDKHITAWAQPIKIADCVGAPVGNSAPPTVFDTNAILVSANGQTRYNNVPCKLWYYSSQLYVMVYVNVNPQDVRQILLAGCSALMDLTTN